MKTKTNNAKTIAFIGMLGALSAVLMSINVPLPFAPTFLKFDIAGLPALFAGFFLGLVSGLLTDEHQQVLDGGFEPIPGLFAAGNCCGGRFGFQYTTSLPGQSISMAQTMGREAGRWISWALAGDIKWEPLLLVLLF